MNDKYYICKRCGDLISFDLAEDCNYYYLIRCNKCDMVSIIEKISRTFICDEKTLIERAEEIYQKYEYMADLETYSEYEGQPRDDNVVVKMTLYTREAPELKLDISSEYICEEFLDLSKKSLSYVIAIYEISLDKTNMFDAININ